MKVSTSRQVGSPAAIRGDVERTRQGTRLGHESADARSVFQDDGADGKRRRHLGHKTSKSTDFQFIDLELNGTAIGSTMHESRLWRSLAGHRIQPIDLSRSRAPHETRSARAEL